MNGPPTILPPHPDCDCGAGNDRRVPHDLWCPWNAFLLYLRRRTLEDAEIVRAAR